MVRTQRRSVLEPSFYVIVALVGLVAAVPLVGLEAWPLELIVNFRLHILIGLVVVALLALVRRYRWLASCLALLALINGGDVVGTVLGSAQFHADDKAVSELPELRVMFANAQRRNDDYDALVAEITHFGPDIVVVAEATDAWAAALGGLSESYPYIISVPRQHAFGMVLLSRFPPMDNNSAEVVLLPTTASWETGPPVAIVARIETEAGPVTVAGLHPYPPLVGDFYVVRNQQMDLLADVIAQQTPPVIAVGDFNATPWSPALRSFMDATGLGGPNILATWPTALGLAGLPIDHILLSRDLTLKRIERGPEIGSDHRPLLAVVVFGADQGSPGTP